MLKKAQNGKGLTEGIMSTSNFYSFIVTIVFFLFTAYASAFSGGTGTTEDPYRIATAEDLISIGSNENLLDKHYILTADIDLTGYQFTTAVIGSFRGTFDGHGHIIRNLTNELFFRIWSREGVKNLGLVNMDGGILAYYNRGTIYNCYTTGYTNKGAGLVRSSSFSSHIENCYSTAIVEGENNVGGLVGTNGSFSYYGEEEGYCFDDSIDGGNLVNCYFTGSVFGTENVGGLIGNCHEGHIEGCYTTGFISGQINVGGLVGQGAPIYLGTLFGDIFPDITT